MLLSSVALHAGGDYPIDAGSMIIGGSAGYHSMDSDTLEGDRNTEFIINSSILYFAYPGMGLGGKVLIRHESYGDNSSTFYGFGPSAAYFLGDRESKLYPFVSASFFFGFLKYDNELVGYDIRQLYFSLGANYMLTTNIALVGEVYYMLDDYKSGASEDYIKGNEFGIQFGIAAFVY
jgi:hypothetical protein